MTYNNEENTQTDCRQQTHTSQGERQMDCRCKCRDCGSDETQIDNSPPKDFVANGVGPDGALLDDEVHSTKRLASLDLSTGARVEFVSIKEDDGAHGVAMRELGDSSRMMPSVLSAMNGASAVDAFENLCPNGPMPKSIAKLSSKTVKRDLVKAISDPVEVDIDELGIELPTLQAGSSSGGGWGGHFCVPGDGWHDFKNFACYWSGPSNTWFWCDPSVAYYWRDRWTTGNYKRKRSFGVTATCGAPAETRHYYKNAFGNWKKLNTWYLPNNHWQWTRYDGLSKRNRWVHHRSAIQGAPSFVRSVTAIYT